MMFCVNFCDIFNMDGIDEKAIGQHIEKIEQKMHRKIERIYFGSYFCDHFFLGFKGHKELIQFCNKKEIPMTLVIPVLSQRHLETGKKRILSICECATSIIDEITVNDVGMLRFVQDFENHELNLGRLFFKNPRDCRVPDYTSRLIAPSLLSKLHQKFWTSQTINCVELDPTNHCLDVSELANDSIMIALHQPYCYITTGKICKFASIHKNIDKKFRPNVSCKMECMHITDIYSGHVVPTNCDPEIYRYGRTLFFENSEVEIVGKDVSRLIYYPIKEWREYLYEDTSSCK